MTSLISILILDCVEWATAPKSGSNNQKTCLYLDRNFTQLHLTNESHDIAITYHDACAVQGVSVKYLNG